MQSEGGREGRRNNEGYDGERKTGTENRQAERPRCTTTTQLSTDTDADKGEEERDAPDGYTAKAICMGTMQREDKAREDNTKKRDK